MANKILNIVIPMAGRGSRFVNAGYKLPKPLIDVNGKTMIEVVVDNLRPKCPHRFVFLCLAEHIEKYDLTALLERIAPNCIIVPVSEVTQGAACTVLLAEKHINNADMLMIANSDQYIDTDINEYLFALRNDGLIMTMKAHDKKWSFISYDDRGLVTEVREKEVISDEATVGIYNFARGEDFVRGAKSMIAKKLVTNGEYYVAPVYNELIKSGKNINYYNIGSIKNGMWGLGTPEDLSEFIEYHSKSMETIIIKTGDIAPAVEIIKRGGLVAVPTETVYGLAGNGLSEAAVAKIYEAKGRPAVKPLSLLVSGFTQLSQLCIKIPDSCKKLADAFWPGPLTMVLRRADTVPDIVTAGGDTVGVRCPRHDLTLELIKQAGVPLAAPSANLANMPSPKNADAVLKYFDGKIDCVIDGGECDIGIESTIVDLTSETFRILRQGALTEREIRAVLEGGC